MKVNIYGRGIIPGLGAIPPVLNKDLSEEELKRIIIRPTFRVYLSDDPSIVVTRKNLHSLIVMTATKGTAASTLVPEAPKAETKVEKKAEPVKEEKVETLVAEEVTAESAPAEEVAAEETVEATKVTAEVAETEEAPKEEAKTSSKKKNRK